MAGMSIPSGFNLGSGFSGSSTAGFTGGQMNPNTTAAVADASGKLEAYDPARMASTATALQQPYQPDPYAIAGFTNGIPNWQANWFQNGGQGELKAPEASTGANQSGPGSAASTFVPPTPMAPIPPPAATKVGTGKQTGSGGYGGAPATTTATKAAADPMAGLTAIPFNAQGGYNQPGLQQPMTVSDQWTGSSSQQMATPQLGQQNSPQMAAGGAILMDGKGGFFMKDAKTGKPVPLTGVGLTAAQGVARSMGYI